MGFNPWMILPPSVAHDLAPFGLKLLAAATCTPKTVIFDPLEWKGLYFRNRLGVAGGVDKEARQVLSWQHLGSGFVEIGTVTPKPQGPNPGKILDRDKRQWLLWNKMGFPNPGMEVVNQRLQELRDQRKVTIPVLVNVGKNRTTDLEAAAEDYLQVMESMHSVADGFVMNISSPNTQGLRQLQAQDSLRTLLRGSLEAYRQKFGPQAKPVVLKLSPDSSPDEFTQSMATAAEHNIDGLILTNTTRRRPKNDQFPDDGGFSGQAVADLSRAALDLAVRFREQNRLRLLIISTGGILSADEVYHRRAAGADLVQVYTALVLQGPFFFSRCLAQFMTSSRV